MNGKKSAPARGRWRRASYLAAFGLGLAIFAAGSILSRQPVPAVAKEAGKVAQQAAPAQGPSPEQLNGKMVSDLAALNKEGELKDMVMGKKNAPNTIIEYSSLTCPHCAHFHENIMPQIREKYIKTGKLKYILREFPLDNLAAAGFMLARCKGDKYNAIIDELYQHQEEWAFVKNPLAMLKEQVKKFGYDDQSFLACLRDQALEVCQKAGWSKSADFQANSLSTLVQMVAAGVGSTLLPEMSLEVEARRPDLLKIMPFENPVPIRRIGMVWRRSSARKREYRQLATYLRDRLTPRHQADVA